MEKRSVNILLSNIFSLIKERKPQVWINMVSKWRIYFISGWIIPLICPAKRSVFGCLWAAAPSSSPGQHLKVELIGKVTTYLEIKAGFCTRVSSGHQKSTKMTHRPDKVSGVSCEPAGCLQVMAFPLPDPQSHTAAVRRREPAPGSCRSQTTRAPFSIECSTAAKGTSNVLTNLMSSFSW